MAASRIEAGSTDTASAPPRPEVPWSTVVQVVLAGAVVAVSAWFLLRAVRAEMSLSLWQDEIYSITKYSSRGAGTTVTTYDVANNHIFFNLLNSLTPGAGSYDPARARLWSIVATVATPVVGLVELGRRRMVLAGALLFAVFATSTPWLQLSLQARGYGVLGLATMVVAVAVWAHLEHGRRSSLVTAAIASVIGCWTVPSFAFFVAPLWIALLAVRRTREVAVAAAVAGGVTVAVYLPVAGQLTSQFGSYGTQFEPEFQTPRDVAASLHSYLMGDAGPVITAVWVVGLLAVVPVTLGWPAGVGRTVRDEARVLLASVAAFILICLILRSAPARTTAFVAVALAVATAVSLGALARQTSIGRVHVAALVVLAVAAVTTIVGVRSQADPDTWIPIENWTGAADYLAAVLPAGTEIFADPPSPNLGHYLHDGQTLARHFDAQAFAEGKMAIVGFNPRSGGTSLDPGVPSVETDVRQQRGTDPPHMMRVRFAPTSTAGVAVTVADQAAPQLTDADLGTTFTSPPQTDLPERYDIVVEVPAGPVRSVALGVVDRQPPRNIAVSIVGPDGSTTPVPDRAVIRSASVITVALDDRPVSEVRITVGQSARGPFSLGDVWIYRPATA